MSCRRRRVKCDETKPACIECRRKGVECRQTDFIVYDGRSMRPIVTEANHGTGSDLADSAQSPSYPKSTYDVLRSAQLIPLPEPRRTPLPFEAELVISEQSAQLLRIYQTGIGTWMDILDHSLTYQRQVVRCALSSGLLLYSICALSAKQMSLVGEQSLWEPVAARYYGESLTLLIQGLNQPQTSHGIVLTATIVLCSYELLANPGPDYKRHLYGAHTLIQTRGVVAQGTALERASFWVYARQDVALAIINESTTLISPQEWRAALPDLGAEEDAMGNKMLWLLARVIELRFTPTENMWPETRSQGFRDVSTELDQWWDDLPSLARGVPIGESTHDELNEVLFYVPSAGQYRN